MTNKQKEDQFLNKLLRSNDIELWDEFYNKYDDFIVMVIHTFKIPKDEVSDLAQDVRLQIWKKLHLYKPNVSKFTTWLSRLIKNKVIDFLRSKYILQGKEYEFSKVERALAHSFTPEIESNAKDEWQKHIFTLAKDKVRNDLSPKVYSVFSEINEGSNTSEIAEKLNIPLNTVHVYKKRITKALRREVKILCKELA